MRIDVRRLEAIKQGDKMLGNRTRAKIVKNKVAPPFKQAEFDIMYGAGISKEGDIMDCAVAEGFIDKAGSWYSYDGTRIGQGRENVKKFLMENPQVMDALESKILDKLNKDKENAKRKTQEKEDIKVDEDGVIIE